MLGLGVPFLLVYVFGTLITQGIGGGILLEQVFGIPYLLAVVLGFVSMLGGFQSVTGVTFFRIVPILIAVAEVVPQVFFSQRYPALIEACWGEPPTS